MARNRRTGFLKRLIGRFPLLAIALVSLSVIACGSGAEIDDTPGALPTAGAAASNTATPNPSSTNEFVMAPDFELPRAGGGTVRLSDVYSHSNTVLVFYRGFF